MLKWLLVAIPLVAIFFIAFDYLPRVLNAVDRKAMIRFFLPLLSGRQSLAAPLILLIRKLEKEPLEEEIREASEGEIGVQADTLMPGLYWRFPIIWRISKSKVTQIPRQKLGRTVAGRLPTVEPPVSVGRDATREAKAALSCQIAGLSLLFFVVFLVRLVHTRSRATR
jgi:hypothetical protein